MQIKLNKYTSDLTLKSDVLNEFKTINLIFGIGGLAGFYTSGLCQQRLE